MTATIETAALRQASTLFGDALLGVVAFGSWARQELATGSDLDLLVVLANDVPIRRDLYRRWDEHPLAWRGHEVEPHFVQLPPPQALPSGLWAEVASDGVVLFERDASLARHLAATRRLIEAGRLRRHTTHGQPYWVT